MIRLQISDIRLDISGLKGKEVITEIYGVETKLQPWPRASNSFLSQIFFLFLSSSLWCMKRFYKLNHISCFVLLFYNCQNSVVLVIDPIAGGPVLIFCFDWHLSVGYQHSKYWQHLTLNCKFLTGENYSMAIEACIAIVPTIQTLIWLLTSLTSLTS